MGQVDLSERLKGVTTLNVNPVKQEVCTFQQTRNEDILTAMKGHGYDNIMPPTETELAYVNSVFQSKGYHQLDNVPFTVVETIGKQEFETLNKELQKFTKSMNTVDASGIFGLIDDLSKDIQDSDLEGIWEKAVNAKPTLLARFISLFNHGYAKRSIQARLSDLHTILTNKGGALEVKIGKIESDLISKRNQQLENIKMLQAAFNLYVKAFEALRSQWMLLTYMEYTYKNMLANYKQTHRDTSDVLVLTKIQEYDRVYNFMQTRRNLMHKTLLHLKVTGDQNNTLINVCTDLMTEMENTRLASFPSIRSSLVNIGASISAQKALLSTESTQNLDRNLAALSQKVTADLAIKTELLASESRLREAQTMEAVVQGLSEFRSNLRATKLQAQQNIDEATKSLTNSTHAVNKILGEITHD